MLITKNNADGSQCGPDYMRMRYKYEVTNGVSEATPENLKLRRLSYLCSIGRTPEVLQIATESELEAIP